MTLDSSASHSMAEETGNVSDGRTSTGRGGSAASGGMHGVNQWYEPADGNPRETKDPARGTTSKLDVASGTRVLSPGSSRIEIQPDDIVPFELPKPAADDGAENTQTDAKPVS